jgi:hypothetical protein
MHAPEQAGETRQRDGASFAHFDSCRNDVWVEGISLDARRAIPP